MVSRTHTYNKSYRSTLQLSNSWKQHVRMGKLEENDLPYFNPCHVVIVVAAVTTIRLMPVMYYCSKLSYFYHLCIVYYSTGMLFFLTHFLKKVLCLFTHDIWSQFYEIDIGCIVVNEIDVILKLLTWARKYNILFHKNKTILLSFKSFFEKVFTFVSMLAFHIRV